MAVQIDSAHEGFCAISARVTSMYFGYKAAHALHFFWGTEEDTGSGFTGAGCTT